MNAPIEIIGFTHGIPRYIVDRQNYIGFTYKSPITYLYLFTVMLIKRFYFDKHYQQINSLLETNTFRSPFEWVPEQLSRLSTDSTLAKFLDHPGQELIMFFRKKSIRPTRVPRANRLMIPSEGREHF